MQVSDLAFIDATGYHYADFPTFQTFVQSIFQNIYGTDIYLGSDSQDGQLAAALAQMAFDTASLGASRYNSFSPATAQGAGLSRVVKINGLRRRIPTFSSADLTIGGTIGTVITNGIAIDTLKQKWNLPATVIIPSAGSVIVTATADTLGDLTASAGTINQIFTPTQGWQTVTNVLAATEGAPVETDAELRLRQSVSTAIPSLTVLEGIDGAVANLTGVVKTRAYDNDLGTTDANGLPGHSICEVVQGGDSTLIAQTIALKKSPGVLSYGNTSITVYDSKGMPILISFQRPTPAIISAVVTISAGAGYSSGFAAMIQQAVADVINAFGIGDTILITKLYYPAYLSGNPAGQSYSVATITLAKNGGSSLNANVNLNFDEVPECDPTTDVTVVVT